ncbi:putative tail structure protein [Nitrincola phage 1M3-16]|uniref:minor tail protein n=1 Tax=Nitrincola phage 1M3-16 TaxID=1472912 RepID=UPI000444E028|nr:minor tail protein [Nitrincola phage 1M3-16]AHX01183.1 putative tail structure protein [Nitrincola phage 1M3-16]
MDVIGYIGIPWKTGGRDVRKDGGLDCWGLVRKIYEDKFNITLPPFTGITTKNSYKECSTQFELEKDKDTDFIEVDDPRKGDIALFTIAGHPIHVGIVLADNQFIHMDDKAGCSIENYKGMKWKSRLQGFYRHKNMK